MGPVFLFFGIGFGWLLSRAGATTYDFYAQLFLFENLQLLWVISGAVLAGVTGLALLRRINARTLLRNEPLSFKGKPFRKGLIAGSLLFGAGWGLSGACPGSALAMIGEGKLAAIPVIGGIVLGTYIYGRFAARSRVTG